MESDNKNVNQEILTEKDTIIVKNTEDFSKVFKNFLKLFAKVYSVRILFSLFKYLKSRAYKNFSFMNFMTYIFNLPNLRTSLFVSLLPLLYKSIKFVLNSTLKLGNQNFIVFMSAMISSFISVSIEEKTELVNYVISTIFVRAVHAVAVIILKKLNILQNTGKIYDFSIFLFSAILAWSVYFLNPRFKPITSLYDKYANYTEKHELETAIAFRDATRLVD
jgi:hypothetical protein